MTSRLATASPRRALVETALLITGVTLFFAGVTLFNEGLTYRVLSQGFIFISAFSSIFLAFRIHFPDADGWLQTLKEVLSATMSLALMTLFSLGLIYLISLVTVKNVDLFSQALRDSSTILSIGISVPTYLASRIAFRIWRYWDQLRRKHLIWSLTHAHLMVAISAGLIMILFFTLLFFLTSGEEFTVPEQAGPLGKALDWFVFTIFPLLGMILISSAIGLFLIVPPSILFSYFVARRMTRRIQELANTTKALRLGDYSARSAIQGADEVAQLQEDFNVMADDLEKTLDDLKRESDTVAGLLENRKSLIAGVSHELRTPIATIRSYLETSIENWDENPSDEIKNNLEVILQEVERLQVLVDDLFSLSRIEVGQLTLLLESVDVEEVIRQVIEVTRPFAQQAGRVEVVSSIQAKFLQICVDRDRLIQCLINLVHNGIRHTSPGGIVAIQVANDAEQMVISVHDTGKGISEEELPKIWERFYAGKGSEGGTGLGLSIVKALVERMGGSVDVESKVSRGSSFFIRLPLV